MIIDSHTHLGETNGKKYTAEDLIAAMGLAGVDRALVIAGKDDPTDEIIRQCEPYDQLGVIGWVDYKNLEQQIPNLVEYLDNGKIKGLKFYTGYERYYPNDSKLFPLYKICEERNKPVIFHTGVLEVGYKGLLKQAHPIEIDEVATLHPNLKIVMAHFGNPWIMDAAAVVAKNPNVYVDLSGYFMEYQSITPEATQEFVSDLKRFKSFVGNFKKCLFGTDWPIYDLKEYKEAVEQLPLTEEEKELVFWGNAKQIFSLEV
jgi:uncharacterized protein